MRSSYRLADISGDRLRLAYPLVQARHPELSLDDWLNHARGHIVGSVARSSGIVAVEDGQGYIVGLFTYRTASCLRHGLVLECENLVALSLHNDHGVGDMLVEHSHKLAKEKGCGAVRIHFHDETDPLQEPVKSAGLTREGVNYCRPLDRG